MDLPVYDMPVYEPALYGDVVHPIESGGNCGYIAIQMGLIAVGEHDQIVPAGPFRQRIYERTKGCRCSSKDNLRPC